MSDLSNLLEAIKEGVESLKKRQKDRKITRVIPLSKENAFLAKKLYAHKEQVEELLKNVKKEMYKIENSRELLMASVVEQIEDYESDFEIDYDGMQVKILADEKNGFEGEDKGRSFVIDKFGNLMKFWNGRNVWKGRNE